jgi:hypothetical protein
VDKANKARKTLFKDTAIGRKAGMECDSTLLKWRAGGFVRNGVS